MSALITAASSGGAFVIVIYLAVIVLEIAG